MFCDLFVHVVQHSHPVEQTLLHPQHEEHEAAEIGLVRNRTLD